MKNKLQRTFFIGLIFSVCSLHLLVAQSITVTGEVKTPLTLQGTDIKGMEHTEVTAKDRDGKERRYSGVPLVHILKKAGVTLGGELRGENLVKYVMIKSADGYEVLFALPEIDPEFTNRVVLLADAVNGEPLPQGMGPYRLVVPDEKRPARWIREIRYIEVRFAK